MIVLEAAWVVLIQYVREDAAQAKKSYEDKFGAKVRKSSTALLRHMSYDEYVTRVPRRPRLRRLRRQRRRTRTPRPPPMPRTLAAVAHHLQPR